MWRTIAGVFFSCLSILSSPLNGQDLPEASVLLQELSRFETSYLGCRLEVDDSRFPDAPLLVNVSKDGKAVSIEAYFPAMNQHTKERIRGGIWANDRYRILATRPTPGDDFSSLPGILGDLRGSVFPFFLGYSCWDFRRLSDIFENASAAKSVSKIDENTFCVEAVVKATDGGTYKIFFERSADKFRVKSWEIVKTRGQSILNNHVKFIVGEENKKLGKSFYEAASKARLSVTFSQDEGDGRPREVKAVEAVTEAGQLERVILTWTQAITDCRKTTMTTTDKVAFETVLLPEIVNLYMSQVGQENHNLLGQSYQLQRGKLVQAASASAISEIKNTPPFREPKSSWGYFVTLGVPAAIAAIILIWLQRNRSNK